MPADSAIMAICRMNNERVPVAIQTWMKMTCSTCKHNFQFCPQRLVVAFPPHPELCCDGPHRIGSRPQGHEHVVHHRAYWPDKLPDLDRLYRVTRRRGRSSLFDIGSPSGSMSCCRWGMCMACVIFMNELHSIGRQPWGLTLLITRGRADRRVPADCPSSSWPP